METKVTLTEVKRVYCADADNKQRGFYAYLRRLQKDAKAAQADADADNAKSAYMDAAKAAKDASKRAADLKRAAAKDASKADAAAKAATDAESAAKAAETAKVSAAKAAQFAKEAAKESAADEMKRESIDALRDVMQRKGLRAEDFTKDYLFANLAERFNEAQQICSVKRVEDADAAEMRAKFADAIVERDGILYYYKPVLLFTANSLLSLFTKAADAKRAAAKAAADNISAAEKERKAAEREAKRYAEAKRRCAEYEAKQAAKAAAEKAA